MAAEAVVLHDDSPVAPREGEAAQPRCRAPGHPGLGGSPARARGRVQAIEHHLEPPRGFDDPAPEAHEVLDAGPVGAWEHLRKRVGAGAPRPGLDQLAHLLEALAPRPRRPAQQAVGRGGGDGRGGRRLRRAAELGREDRPDPVRRLAAVLLELHEGARAFCLLLGEQRLEHGRARAVVGRRFVGGGPVAIPAATRPGSEPPGLGVPGRVLSPLWNRCGSLARPLGAVTRTRRRRRRRA